MFRQPLYICNVHERVDEACVVVLSQVYLINTVALPAPLPRNLMQAPNLRGLLDSTAYNNPDVRWHHNNSCDVVFGALNTDMFTPLH